MFSAKDRKEKKRKSTAIVGEECEKITWFEEDAASTEGSEQISRGETEKRTCRRSRGEMEEINKFACVSKREKERERDKHLFDLVP